MSHSSILRPAPPRLTRRRALAMGGAAAMLPYGLRSMGAAAQDGSGGSDRGGVLPVASSAPYGPR